MIGRMLQAIKQAIKIPIHPFLFAALPAIIILSIVRSTFLPESAIPLLVVTELVVTLFFLLAFIILRDVEKAAVISSFLISILFSYRFLRSYISLATGPIAQIIKQPAPEYANLCVYLILVLVLAILLVRDKFAFGRLNYPAFTESLNLVAIGLVVFNLCSLIPSEIEDGYKSNKFVSLFKRHFDSVALDGGGAKNDIYYLVVDGFADWRTIEHLTGSKELSLYKFLEKNHFYVVPKAASNYDRTELSLSSSLNMQYVNPVSELIGRDDMGENVYNRMLQDNAVVRLLHKLGYKFYNISSGDCPTDYILEADGNFCASYLNTLVAMVSTLTPLQSTEVYWPVLRDLEASFKLCPDTCLSKVVGLPGPKFTLIHSDLFHTPCIFDEKGNKLPYPANGSVWAHTACMSEPPRAIKELYVFSQKKFIDWVSLILRQSSAPPIIIIQSDHGLLRPHESVVQMHNSRMRILNAYYLPGQHNKGLYDTITPVNSFRVVLNDYFKAGLPLLPDKSYASDHYGQTFYWRDVTGDLNFSGMP